MQKISLDIPEEVYQELKKRAKHMGVGHTQLARAVLKEYVENFPHGEARGRLLGLPTPRAKGFVSEEGLKKQIKELQERVKELEGGKK